MKGDLNAQTNMSQSSFYDVHILMFAFLFSLSLPFTVKNDVQISL